MNKRRVIEIIIMIVLVAALGLLYRVFGEKTAEGSKSITIEVIDSTGESTMYNLKTDAEYLSQAMDEAEGLEYELNGTYVDSVNGELADYNVNGAYWGFYINDEYCNYGITEQPIKDGDVFKIEYTLSE